MFRHRLPGRKYIAACAVKLYVLCSKELPWLREAILKKRVYRGLCSELAPQISCKKSSGVYVAKPLLPSFNVLNEYARVKFKKNETRWIRTEVTFEISATNLL